MIQDSTPREPAFIPPQPIPPGARDFNRRVRSLMDGRPKDEATVAKALEGMDWMLDVIAAGLYNLASMLIGEGEQSVLLIEKAVATAEVAVCCDPALARQSSRRALVKAALEMLAQRDPESLASPQGFLAAPTCIEDDDLDAAGVSHEELEKAVEGPDRQRVRDWLASLSPILRTVFAMRAVAGFTSAQTAELLAAHGGPKAAGWTSESVRVVFRQALCSLASQMLHESAVRN